VQIPKSLKNMSALFKKYARYFYLVVATVLVLWTAFAYRQLLLPFIVGAVLAYMLFPLVKIVERHFPWGKRLGGKGKRICAIFFVILMIFVVLGLIVFLAISAIWDSASKIFENASHFIDTTLSYIQDWISSMGVGLTEGWQERLDNVAASLGNLVDDAIESLFANGGGAVASTLGGVFGFAALPLFLFYLLKDAEKLKRGVFGVLQPDIARHGRHIVDIIERTMGRYIRAQLILGAIVAAMTLFGLLIILPPEVAIPLALVNGFFEMIPTFGPIIGGIIMVVVVLAFAPDMVLWVIVLAVVVQLLENNFLVPRIQAAALRLHPAAVLFLLVTGSYFWGFWGLVLIVPVVSTFIDIFKYVHAMGEKKDAPKLLPPGNTPQTE